MTHRLARLLPLAAILAVLGGLTVAFAAAIGSASSPALSQGENGRSDVAADCAPPCDDTVDIGAPDIAAVCAEGPAADCVDTVEPGDPIADCQYDPCYDTPALVPDPLGDRCKQVTDDMVACIADPDTPVSSGGPSVEPADPPDAGPVSEPYQGNVIPENELAEDIAAREECARSGACD